jgi:hypothetical protein
MAEQISAWLAGALELYALVGAIFGLAFITFGVQRIDSGAKGSGIGFRLLIFPCSLAFWPLLLRRWIGGQRDPAEEANPHS